MVLNHVTVVIGLAWDIGSPGLIFVTCLILKLEVWFMWGSGTNVILRVKESFLWPFLVAIVLVAVLVLVA